MYSVSDASLFYCVSMPLSSVASLYLDNSMIVESLTGGCMGTVTEPFDGGHGRVMGDVSTVFVVEALQMYEWSADTAFLTTLEPVILKAINWFAHVGTNGTALPHKQCCT